MAENSGIEWTHLPGFKSATWNPIAGCTPISPGCAHCYAETMAARLKAMALADIAAGKDPGRKRHYIDAIDDKGRWSGKLIPVPEALADPLSWRKPRTVFVNSMSDLFHESIPDDFIDQVFAVMALCGQHIFQVLTKRAERLPRYFSRDRSNLIYQAVQQLAEQHGIDDYLFDDWPWPHVWLGVSAENQQRADERIPWLLKTPAAVRFVSAEPLLGPIDMFSVGPLRWDVLRGWKPEDEGYPEGANTSALDWLIVGGESGPGARACNVAWVRSIVRQCGAAGVPCFVKQVGSNPWLEPGELEERRRQPGYVPLRDKKGGDPSEWPEDLRVRQFPEVASV